MSVCVTGFVLLFWWKWKRKQVENISFPFPWFCLFAFFLLLSLHLLSCCMCHWIRKLIFLTQESGQAKESVHKPNLSFTFHWFKVHHTKILVFFLLTNSFQSLRAYKKSMLFFWNHTRTCTAVSLSVSRHTHIHTANITAVMMTMIIVTWDAWSGREDWFWFLFFRRQKKGDDDGKRELICVSVIRVYVQSGKSWVIVCSFYFSLSLFLSSSRKRRALFHSIS